MLWQGHPLPFTPVLVQWVPGTCVHDLNVCDLEKVISAWRNWGGKLEAGLFLPVPENLHLTGVLVFPQGGDLEESHTRGSCSHCTSQNPHAGDVSAEVLLYVNHTRHLIRRLFLHAGPHRAHFTCGESTFGAFL